MLALAWRNLWRQRRRSLTTLGAVALVVAFSLVYYGLGGAMANSMFRSLTGSLGMVQVHVRDYRAVHDPSASLLRDATEVRTDLVAALPASATDALVVGALDAPALILHGDRSRALPIQGRDWPEPLRQRYLASNALEGRFVAPDDPSGIVLGRGLARALAVGIGDDVAAYAPGGEGYGAASFVVTGLVDTQDPALGSRTALVSLAAAQALAGPDAVTRFEVHLPWIHRLDEDTASTGVADALAAAVPDLQVETWRQLSPDLVGLLDAFGPMLAVITLIFFVLAGLLVVNTVYLGLIERMREFGVLLSLGLSGRRLMGLITLESVLLCLTGAAVGFGVGLGAVSWMARGFTFPGFERIYASFGMDPTLYASLAPGQALLAVVFTVATGILAALWPASLASRLEPVEAMRFTA